MDLLVLQQENGTEMMERSEPVPVTLAKRRVTLAAAPGGGAARTLTFRLPASKGKRGAVKEYSFVVQPRTGAASREADPESEEELPTALVSVVTHEPEAYSVSIEQPTQVTPGQPFELTVRVKNPGKKAIERVALELGPAPEELHVMAMGRFSRLLPGDSDDWSVRAIGTGDEDVVIASLAPGEEKLLRYQVTPEKAVGRFTVLASAWSKNAGNALDLRAVEIATPVAAR
jgi:hypothetical protein